MLNQSRKKRDEYFMAMESQAMQLEERRTRAIMLESEIQKTIAISKRQAVAVVQAKLDSKTADFDVPGFHFMNIFLWFLC